MHTPDMEQPWPRPGLGDKAQLAQATWIATRRCREKEVRGDPALSRLLIL